MDLNFSLEDNWLTGMLCNNSPSLNHAIYFGFAFELPLAVTRQEIVVSSPRWSIAFLVVSILGISFPEKEKRDAVRFGTDELRFLSCSRRGQLD